MTLHRSAFLPPTRWIATEAGRWNWVDAFWPESGADCCLGWIAALVIPTGNPPKVDAAWPVRFEYWMLLGVVPLWLLIARAVRLGTDGCAGLLFGFTVDPQIGYDEGPVGCGNNSLAGVRGPHTERLVCRHDCNVRARDPVVRRSAWRADAAPAHSRSGWQPPPSWAQLRRCAHLRSFETGSSACPWSFSRSTSPRRVRIRALLTVRVLQPGGDGDRAVGGGRMAGARPGWRPNGRKRRREPGPALGRRTLGVEAPRSRPPLLSAWSGWRTKQRAG